MIESFKHKGLKRLYHKGDRSGIRPDLLARVEDILSRLDVIEMPEDMNLPGYRLHKLTGELKEFWSVTVNANWRIIFRMSGGAVQEVELIDYH